MLVKMKHPIFKNEPHIVGATMYQIDAEGCTVASEEHARMMEQGRWVRIGIVAPPVSAEPQGFIPRTLADIKNLIAGMGLKALDVLQLGREMEREETGPPVEAAAEVEPTLPAVAKEEWDPFGLGPELVAKEPEPAPTSGGNGHSAEPETEEIEITPDSPMELLRGVADKLGVKYSRATSAARLYTLCCREQERANG